MTKIFDGKIQSRTCSISVLWTRRGEGSELNISVLDVLERIDWMMGDAIYHINKGADACGAGRLGEMRNVRFGR